MARILQIKVIGHVPVEESFLETLSNIVDAEGSTREDIARTLRGVLVPVDKAEAASEIGRAERRRVTITISKLRRKRQATPAAGASKKEEDNGN